MHVIKSLFLLAGLALAGANASAAAAAPMPVSMTPQPSPLDRYFVHIDQNDDGRIDRTEVAANRWLTKRFSRIDSNRDRTLDKDELRSYRMAIQARHKEQLDAHLKATGQSGTLAMSKTEAADAMMFRIVDNFDEIDRNHDGLVTRNELQAYALNTRRYVPMT